MSTAKPFNPKLCNCPLEVIDERPPSASRSGLLYSDAGLRKPGTPNPNTHLKALK